MQAIDKVSVVQQAVEQLKTYISSNDLEVGQKLPAEKELCAQLAIGRGSLREALRILAATLSNPAEVPSSCAPKTSVTTKT